MKYKKTKIILIILVSIIIIGVIFFIVSHHLPQKNEKVSLDKELYNNYSYQIINKDELNKLISDKHSFVLFAYNSFCSFPLPCEDVFQKTMEKLNIRLYAIPFSEARDTSFFDTVSYAPSIAIYKSGKIIAYLDPSSKTDYDYYQDENKFEEWLTSKIIISS